jgi:hypothetical protein
MIAGNRGVSKNSGSVGRPRPRGKESFPLGVVSKTPWPSLAHQAGLTTRPGIHSHPVGQNTSSAFKNLERGSLEIARNNACTAHPTCPTFR